MAQFEVLELLGEGGFGQVYRARDTRLGRTVALKVLPEAYARDPERQERFRREAIAASALNHPNICTVHDLVDAGGRALIVMELVEGQTLHAALARGPLPAAEAAAIGMQVADALAEAHRAGILHRDVKCRNIALSRRGTVKVLDFGLAKLVGPAEEETSGTTLEKLTAEGGSPGTPGYMSPEQLLGRPVDGRSDLFSLGVVLYRMVTGRLPFEGGSALAVAHATLSDEPRPFGDAPVPFELQRVVRRLLEKEPERRYASGEEVRDALGQLPGPARRSGLSRAVGAGLAAGLIAVVAAGGWMAHRWSRQRWALAQVREIERLEKTLEYTKAAALLREVHRILPDDPAVEKLWSEGTNEVSLETVPPGAVVSFRPCRGDPEAWESLGRTPIRKARVPADVYVWRVAKEGFAAQTWIGFAPMRPKLTLDPLGSVPPDMVRVPGGDWTLVVAGLERTGTVKLDDYLIDRTEVTNEAFRRFVDAGGYRERALWKVPFVEEGRAVPWDEAVARFVDETGRPGPATWELGSFPKGREKHPVAGVSWYEAAAYAEFAGRSLPTVTHWFRAAQAGRAEYVVTGSNFRGRGPVEVGGDRALSGHGTFDMAGNVKEWCWNEAEGGRRFLLGGSFGEPEYMFTDPDARSPWERRPTTGFRCAKLPAPAAPRLAGRLEVSFRDFSREKPVPDEVFAAYRSLYAYDHDDLDARVEEKVTEESWRREKVSFRAAYGGERVVAQLLLPKDAAPPYQTVVLFPGDYAIQADRWGLEASEVYDFVPRAGRALLYPIYKGTFERKDGLRSSLPEPTAAYRDHVVAWSRDLGRSLDYLETRPDLVRGAVAFYGVSWGAELGPVLLAVEPRFRAAVLLGGGLVHARSLPEADKINFVGRARVPVLFLNGRYDFIFPVASSVLPMVRLFGTPGADKRHVLYDTGHFPPYNELVRETLAWLDRTLGPVGR